MVGMVNKAYENKIDETIRAYFPPGANNPNLKIYFCYSRSLQYVYIRNFEQQ
jgi:hypothetical protein